MAFLFIITTTSVGETSSYMIATVGMDLVYCKYLIMCFISLIGRLLLAFIVCWGRYIFL
jgi:hypothetical protein